MSKIIVDRLTMAMQMRNICAAELARRCGLDRSIISRYLRGRANPKFQSVEVMASVLGVSATWLYGIDEDAHIVEVPIVRNDCPIEFDKLTRTNKIRLISYYQALLDTQTKIPK